DHRPTLILWMIEPHASAHRTGRLDVSAPVSSTADQPRLVRDVGKLVGVQTEIEVEILLDHRVLPLLRVDDSRVAVREANLDPTSDSRPLELRGLFPIGATNRGSSA